MAPQVNPIQAGDRAVTAFSTCTLLGLSTEVLIEILSYLEVADIWSVQRTCHTLRDIVAGTAYLQYILRTRINGVHDFLPPNCPYSDRLELLRRHEQSWAGLQLRLNLLTTCVNSMPPYLDRFTLQDSYLICQSLMGSTPRYGYTDLSSTAQNKEAHWVYITIDNDLIIRPSKVVFAVDHDLVVAISEQLEPGIDVVRVQLAFLEFTTGKPHPLSSTHTVLLPPLDGLRSTFITAEVLGDHVLVLACHIAFFLVSWKTGTVTLIPETSRVTGQTTTRPSGAFKPLVIDDSVYTVTVDSMNRLEICKLEINPPGPCLQAVCFLELPSLTPGVVVVLHEVLAEWVPTSNDYARWSCRERHVPFYSSTVGTIAFLLDYLTSWEKFLPQNLRTMVVSVEGLLSVIRTGTHNVPWVDWGPSSTHIFQRTPWPAGPFWITDLSPLVVRQFGLPHMRVAQSIVEDTSHTGPEVYCSMESLSEEFWGVSVQTKLPYRDIMANDLNFGHFQQVMVNREWVVGVAWSLVVRGFYVCLLEPLTRESDYAPTGT